MHVRARAHTLTHDHDHSEEKDPLAFPFGGRKVLAGTENLV